MPSEITNLHCDACDAGIVKLVVSGGNGTITASVRNCNKCKKSFGFKGVAGLKVIDKK